MQIDEKFLEQCGLGELSAEKKKALLQQIHSTLEERVGAKLTESMSEEQVDEFGKFIEGDKVFLDEWFAKNDPNYAKSEVFKQMKQHLPEVSETDLMAEYGAMRWLQLTRPDYPQVVKDTLSEMGEELSANKERILAA